MKTAGICWMPTLPHPSSHCIPSLCLLQFSGSFKGLISPRVLVGYGELVHSGPVCWSGFALTRDEFPVTGQEDATLKWQWLCLYVEAHWLERTGRDVDVCGTGRPWKPRRRHSPSGLIHWDLDQGPGTTGERIWSKDLLKEEVIQFGDCWAKRDSLNLEAGEMMTAT